MIVIGALALARYLFDKIGSGPRPDALARGLFAWDGWHYREIAEHGYRAGPAGNQRFFPFFPLLGRALGTIIGGHSDVALLLVANFGGLLVGSLLHRLVMRETHDAALARRSVWLGALLPQMYVLVLAYSEAAFMSLSIGVFLCLRSRRWWLAASLAVLAGLTRPFGVLLVLPAAIEAARAWGGSRLRDRLASVAAILGPAAGLGLFLAWSARVYGDALEPFHVQETPGLRGATVDPLSSLRASYRQLVGGEHLGAGAHVLWAPLLILALVAAARRLPAAYTVYASAVLLLSLSSQNIGSFERYAISAFPVVIGVAALTAKPRDLWPAVLAVSAAGLLTYSVLVFVGRFVP